jgi:hypothetical protein
MENKTTAKRKTPAEPARINRTKGFDRELAEGIEI